MVPQGRIAHGHKLAALMKKIKEEILRHKEQSTEQLQNSQMILMSMALMCLLSLPLVFVYFLHITLSTKIKNLSMKNKINHQKDVICFTSCIINE